MTRSEPAHILDVLRELYREDYPVWWSMVAATVFSVATCYSPTLYAIGWVFLAVFGLLWGIYLRGAFKERMRRSYAVLEARTSLKDRGVLRPMPGFPGIEAHMPPDAAYWNLPGYPAPRKTPEVK